MPPTRRSGMPPSWQTEMPPPPPARPPPAAAAAAAAASAAVRVQETSKRLYYNSTVPGERGGSAP